MSKNFKIGDNPMQKITLKEAAALISNISGHEITHESLRNQIARNQWKYNKFLSEKPLKHWLLYEKDVIEYAKKFKGICRGRKIKEIIIDNGRGVLFLENNY